MMEWHLHQAKKHHLPEKQQVRQNQIAEEEIPEHIRQHRTVHYSMK